MQDLEAQRAQLQGEEEKLTLASQRLQAKVESFRTQKETIKAKYTAAEAQTRINEAFSGISEEMGDVGMAVQRAEDKTAQMQARAGAIDELIASGALDDASSLNRRRRHLARAGVDVLAVRRGVRARGAQGRLLGDPAAAGARGGRRCAVGRAGAGDAEGRGLGMIVRILGEGQRELSEAEVSGLNDLDAAVEKAVEAGDTTTFTQSLAALLDAVRAAGAPLADESLEDSDLILPPSDATLEEVRELLNDDGLIPG